MKWYALLFWFAWVLPSVISMLRLWFDKDRGTVSHFLSYCWWSFVPVWNLVLVGIVLLDLKDSLIDWYKSRNIMARIVFEFAVKVWVIMFLAMGFIMLIHKLAFYDFTK